MVQLVKTVANKFNYLSSIPLTHVVDGENRLSYCPLIAPCKLWQQVESEQINVSFKGLIFEKKYTFLQENKTIDLSLVVVVAVVVCVCVLLWDRLTSYLVFSELDY